MLKNIVFALCLMASFAHAKTGAPLQMGVVGLTHDHVHWILGYKGSDIEIVGIVEPDQALARRYANQYGFSMDIVYSDIDAMIRQAKPAAVAAFTSIFDHLYVVEKCAPKGIHVMVEKPLAVSLEHAQKMASLARQHNIHLITNYETTWYASNHRVSEILSTNELGTSRKIVVHDGHKGPAEIGVSEEFLQWLTDPVQNGGGAVIDFGCYGANLITWLMNGQRPLSVTAVLQQIKPETYPKVDDEATIILTYPGMQGIIQASWNWPFSRKDMEVYGESGYAIAVDHSTIRIRRENEEGESIRKEPSLPSPYDNPFSYFTALVRGEIGMKPTDLSALETNLVVVEILDAARRSAESGETVFLTQE